MNQSEVMKSVKQHKTFLIIIIVQIIILFIIMAQCIISKKNIEIVSPPLSFWQSRIIQFDEENSEWFASGQFYREAGYEVNEDTEFIYGPYINLPQGDYILSISYQVDSDEKFHMYAFEQEDKIHCWQDDEVLTENSSRIVRNYTLTDDVEGLEVRVCFNGQGNLHIKDITIVKDYMRPRVALFTWALLFLAMDILIVLWNYLKFRKKSLTGRAVILSVIVVIAMNINLDPAETYGISDELIGVFGGYNIYTLLILIPLVIFFENAIKYTEEYFTNVRARVCVLVPAVLFSFFVVMGYSYEKVNSWNLLFDGMFSFAGAFIKMIGISALLVYLIMSLFKFLDTNYCGINENICMRRYEEHLLSGSKLKRIVSWYVEKLHKKPFLTAFFTIGVLYLPWIVLSYPAISTGDTADIILQAFNVPGGTEEDVIQLSPSVCLNQHHPVIPTLIVHAFILFGAKIFKSANLGLFIYCILQTAITLIGESLLVSTLEKENVHDGIVIAVIAFFGFNPRIQNYIFVLTKDACYAAWLLVALIMLWRLIYNRQKTKWTFQTFVMLLVLLVFFHNAGIYLVLALIMAGLVSKLINRREGIIAAVVVIGIYTLATKVIFPLNDISSGTVNEALSIPIQQTARYLRDYPEDVKDWEKQAIDSVWQFDKLADNYDPVLSDGTKNTFNKYSTGGELRTYLKAWASMLLRHPDAYIQATMNNYYEYFYPGNVFAKGYMFNHSPESLEYSSYKIAHNGIEGINLYWPDYAGLDKARSIFETVRETVFRLPILSAFLSVAFYSWILILAIMYRIYRKNGKGLLMLTPLIIVMLCCIASSSNGSYFRYFYPIVLCMPTLLLGLQIDRGR